MFSGRSQYTNFHVPGAAVIRPLPDRGTCHHAAMTESSEERTFCAGGASASHLVDGERRRVFN